MAPASARRAGAPRLALPWAMGCSALLTACAGVQLNAPPRLGPTPVRLRAPRPPAPSAGSTGRQHARRGPWRHGVALGAVVIETTGPAPEASTRARFRRALARRLRQAFPRRDTSAPPARVNLVYRYDVHGERNLSLDVLNTLTLGLMPYAPERGAALVELLLRGQPGGPAAPEGGRLRPYRARILVAAPYHTAAVPWFNRSRRQARLDDAHLVAFRKLVRHLRWWLESSERSAAPNPRPNTEAAHDPRPNTEVAHARRPRRREPPPGNQNPAASARPARPRPARPRQARPRPARSRPARPRPARPHPARPRWYQIGRHVAGESTWLQRRRGADGALNATEVVEAKVRTSWFSDLLQSVGGVAVGYSQGYSWVQSALRDATGRRHTAASGRGQSRGASATLFVPPQGSGLYFFPTAGFLFEEIRIQDRQGVVDPGDPEGATGIPAVATDPATGQEIDLFAPWGYQLRMTSLYLGARVGASLVLGSPRTQFFLSAEAGINLLEWRTMKVRWDEFRTQGNQLAGAGSTSGRILMGVAYRPWHLALLCTGTFDYYRRFQYPEPIPFRGREEYDPNLDAYVRPIRSAHALTLETLTLFFGAVVFY